MGDPVLVDPWPRPLDRPRGASIFEWERSVSDYGRLLLVGDGVSSGADVAMVSGDPGVQRGYLSPTL